MPPKDTLANRVRVARERLGITQVDLARDVGISRQALISVEKGRMNPSVVVSLKIARILREPVDYLFYIDGRDGEALASVEPRVAKAPPKPKAATPAPQPVPAPEPTPEPEPAYAEEVEAQPIADEPHIVLDPEGAHEFEPEVHEEPPEVIVVEAEELPEPQTEPEPETKPEPEPAPTRHAVPVSAEPKAPAQKSAESGDEPDDVQLSLFE